MKHFHVGELTRWQPIAPGQFAFEFIKETRNVKASFKSNGIVELWATDPEESGEKNATLLCVADGEFTLDVILPSGSQLLVKAEKDTAIFMQMHAKQKVPQRTSDEIFTDLNPRKAPSDFERMMHIVQQNERARDEVLKREVKRSIQKAMKAREVVIDDDDDDDDDAADAKAKAKADAKRKAEDDANPKAEDDAEST